MKPREDIDPLLNLITMPEISDYPGLAATIPPPPSKFSCSPHNHSTHHHNILLPRQYHNKQPWSHH